MALIKRIPQEPKVDFLGKRLIFMTLGAIFVVSSIVLFLLQGLNFGVDFRGGILIEIETKKPEDLGALRSRLSGLGLGEITLQEFGDPTDILLNVQRQEGEESEQIKAIDEIKTELGDLVAEYRRTEFVGPKVGDELREAGVLATILALAGIGLYVWFRFEWQFAVAALVALILAPSVMKMRRLPRKSTLGS